ncbi:MAG: ABC transporter permease [Ruminococcaceae bacterium]|nr:ABC transporter permease [Oscillospiraceae bacterium]
MENKEFNNLEESAVEVTPTPADIEEPDYKGDDELLERNVKLMSPMQMVLRRFFRSKLSIIGLVLIIGLFVFCWVGPLIYNKWEPTEMDNSGKWEVETPVVIEYEDEDGKHEFYKVTEVKKKANALADPSSDHPLGTDKIGRDVLARVMEGGKVSLTISFLSVFIITLFGVVFGGIAGYFGGVIDNIIMRLCDILMCLPGFPILLIVGTVLQNESLGIASQHRIYYLMGFLTLISWSGTARLVRGQILSLREQEYMVAAEAMGYSTGRKIFKHLVPNVMPQLIVSMTLSLGSMILYEASLSYLGLGAPEQHAAWGTMINIVVEDPNILENYFNIWGPPGICIILAVLGFNFIGDGLRDALDPKMRR